MLTSKKTARGWTHFAIQQSGSKKRGLFWLLWSCEGWIRIRRDNSTTIIYTFRFRSRAWEILSNRGNVFLMFQTHMLLMDAFLQNNRLDHVSRVMSSHPTYLETFLRTQNFILRGDGPLPYDYRHLIAIMVSTFLKLYFSILPSLFLSFLNDILYLSGTRGNLRLQKKFLLSNKWNKINREFNTARIHEGKKNFFQFISLGTSLSNGLWKLSID